MGATVTTGKQVCAIRDAKTGTPIYLLFEETYEKNCYPHTPSWSCICIGGIERAMQYIFAHASSCEGGMLQGRSGHITPEGYVQAWMKLLREPLVYPDVRTDWTMGEKWGDSITPAECERAKAALQGNPDALALLDELEQSDEGRGSFMLHERIGALAAILEAARRPPWHVVNQHYTNLEVDCRLGYNPKNAGTYAIVIPEVVRIDRDERLMRDADGLWRSAGWAYSIVGNYIDALWRDELREPGSYKKRIKAYRQAVDSAPLAQFPMRVRLDTRNMLGISGYGAKDMRDIVESFAPVADSPGAFTVNEPSYEITHAPRGVVIWEPVAMAA